MWQGIPFKYTHSYVHETVTVLIDKLPSVNFLSTTDYTGPALTGLATLIGGLIPAVIAFRAIKENKDQMLAQQIIINRQHLIENLRVKMSIFAADCVRIAIFVDRKLTKKGLTLHGAPEEIHDAYLELAHALDREYNYMELLVGGEPKFARVLSLMKEISENFLSAPEGNNSFDLYEHIELLSKETISCLSNEWKEVISLK